jgi:hypothetical protein
MQCPACKIPMNHHADKLVKSGDGRDVLASIHQCPACGNAAAEIRGEIPESGKVNS